MARNNTQIADLLRARFDQVIATDQNAAIAFLLGGTQNGSADNQADDSDDMEAPTARQVADRRRNIGRGNVVEELQTARAAVRQTVRKTRERFATKAYQVKRNRAGNPVGEPKRPADVQTWKFLVRHRKPVTIIELEKATGLSNSVLRNNLYRMQNEGIIDTVANERE